MPVPLSIRRFLHFRSATCPSFSPGGEHVAFITDITGVPQIWKVGSQGGWPQQLTFYSERVLEALYSPTQDLIAFTMDLGGNERAQLYTVTDDGHIVTRITSDESAICRLGPWSPDGRVLAFSSNRRAPEFFDVYLTDPLTGDISPILSQDHSDHPLCWLDQHRLLIQRTVTNLDSELILVDVATGRAETISPGPAVYRSAHAANGHLYVVTDQGQDLPAVARIATDAPGIDYVWTSQYEVDSLALDSEGQMIISENRDGYSLVLHSPAGDLDLRPVSRLSRGVVSGLSFCPDGSQAALAVSAPTLPSDVWVLNCHTRRSQQVTQSSTAGIPRERLCEPELITYRSFDDTDIPAFLYLPSESPPPHPVVIDIHGGPESQRRPQMDPVIQYLVHRGYAILSPNVRGSSGYGRRYIQMDDVEKRMDAVRDIGRAFAWIQSRQDLDDSRVAPMGASYGGFMVLACLAEYPDLWKAGIDLVGIANFETFLERTGPWRRRLRESEYGSLERDRDLLRSISPLHRADRIQAPLLVIHGANDPRVPIGEAEQIVTTLRNQGGTVEYLVLPDEGHGITKLANRLQAYGLVVDFLDRHLE